MSVAYVTELSAGRARRFLRRLVHNPFVALVVEGEHVHVYTHEMDAPTAAQLRLFLDEWEDKISH